MILKKSKKGEDQLRLKVSQKKIGTRERWKRQEEQRRKKVLIKGGVKEVKVEKKIEKRVRMKSLLMGVHGVIDKKVE